MFNKVKKLFVVPMIALVGLMSLTITMPQTVSAQSAICSVFPFLDSIGLFGINNAICRGQSETTGTETAVATANFIQLILSLIFVGIIIVAVYIIIKSAIKYIRSEGEEGKVQEAQKSIKTVFVGIAALFIGILGIVLVLAFFRAGGAVSGQVGDTGTDTFIDDFINSLFGNGCPSDQVQADGTCG